MRTPTADRGFTLIELMVVMLILAVLIGMSLVAYGRFEQRAEDSRAQTELRHTMLAQQALHGDMGAYSDVVADFADFEPEVHVNLMSASDFGVYIEKFDANTVCLMEDGGGGKILAVWLASDETPQFGKFPDQDTADLFVCDDAAPGWSTQGW